MILVLTTIFASDDPSVPPAISPSTSVNTVSTKTKEEEIALTDTLPMSEVCCVLCSSNDCSATTTRDLLIHTLVRCGLNWPRVNKYLYEIANTRDSLGPPVWALRNVNQDAIGWIAAENDLWERLQKNPYSKTLAMVHGVVENIVVVFELRSPQGSDRPGQ